MNELFSNVMDGRNSHVHDDVERVLGRPAKTFRDYVLKTKEQGVWKQVENAEHAV